MIDDFDYKEPRCLLCDGKDFYYPDGKKPIERIPVNRIISKIDECFEKNDMAGAGKVLEYWANEAVAFNDLDGELAVMSEMMGYYRKTGEKEKALKSVKRGFELINLTGREKDVSTATVMLNGATTLKAFGQAEKAEKIYGEVLEVYNKFLDKNDEKFGGFYNNFALCLQDLKKYEKAEDCFKKALAVMKNVKGGKPDMAITYSNLATLYELWLGGEDKKIEECLDKAFSLLDGDDVTKNGYYAYVCEKCAPVFGYFGYFLQDAELKKRAKEIYERNRTL